jgi:putative phage-type endonuclease
MAQIVKLVQGSPEWHEHRQLHRNASETPAVLGVSPWVTPYQLWLHRTGRAEPAVNPAMRRGSELEPAAREAYEQLTGNVMQPLVLVDGEYSASLDGLTFDGDLVLEVKCPARGRESDLWEQVQAGQLPEHYRWQVEHQLMVSGAKLAHVYVFDGRQGVLLEQRPDSARWMEIHRGWEAFMRFVVRDAPPPLTDRDTVDRDDAAWEEAAKRFLAAKAAAEESAAQLEVARQTLVGLTGHPSERGAGVCVTRYWRAGAIDYKRVPQLAGVDLEGFRGPSREEVRVTVAR